MRILYLVSNLSRTGPTNQLFYITKNLVKDNEVNILTLSAEPEDTMMKDFLNNGIKVNSLGLSRIKTILYGKMAVKNYIKKMDPDIVHTQGIRADSLVSKLKLKNHICTARNYPFEDYPVKYGFIIGTIMAFKHLNSYREIENKIACSNSLADKFYNKRNLKFKAIQNGVDMSKYPKGDQKQKDENRKELRIRSDETVLIFIGSLIDRKDPLNLAKAFHQIPEKNIKLIFLGEGPLKQELLNYSKADDRIILEGEVKDVQKYLIASDIFVSPSKSEGLPNTVLEAMSVGLPVILSDIGPHSEILEINPEVGILFQTCNDQELKDSMTKFLNENFKNLSEKAPRSVIENQFSDKIMAERYLNYYSNLV